MKTRILAGTVCLALSAVTGVAQAAGCLKGAALGGIAGHYAGHHAVVGAIGGCVVGRHLANKKAAEQAAPAQPPVQQRNAPASNQRESLQQTSVSYR